MKAHRKPGKVIKFDSSASRENKKKIRKAKLALKTGSSEEPPEKHICYVCGDRDARCTYAGNGLWVHSSSCAPGTEKWKRSWVGHTSEFRSLYGPTTQPMRRIPREMRRIFQDPHPDFKDGKPIPKISEPTIDTTQEEQPQQPAATQPTRKFRIKIKGGR